MPLIVIDPFQTQPLYRQVETQLREAILSGRMRPGVRLPGVRTLANELGLARITVSVAYDELAADGLIERTVGSGSRVSIDPPEPYDFAPIPALRRRPEDHVAETKLDLRPGRVASDLVPFELWDRVLRTSLRELVDTDMDRLDTIEASDGDALLQEELASFLGATRGIMCRPDQLFILSSAQAACAAIAEVTSARGPWVVEDPGDRRLHEALEIHGPLTAIPVDRDGIVTDQLPPFARGLLTSATWQFPCGGTLSDERREVLLAWAEETGATIVETDFEGHLHLSGQPARPLRSRSDAASVIYVGTFSTLLFPGLRTAYALIPDHLTDRFRRAARRHERGAAAIEQRALALFLREGHLARHVVRVRRAYRARQAALRAGLEKHLAGLVDSEPAAYGAHLLLRLSPEMRTGAFVRAAAAAGLAFDPLSAYAMRPAEVDGLIASYARVSTVVLDDCLAQLAGSLAALRPPRDAPSLRRPQRGPCVVTATRTA